MTADGWTTSRNTAWLSLWANVMVVPGLGTLFLGRSFLGSSQLLLALLATWLLLSGSTSTQAFALGLSTGVLAWSVATAVTALRKSKAAIASAR